MNRRVVPLFALLAFGCSAPSGEPSSSIEAVGVSQAALSSSAKEVTSFGSNPGALKLYEYVPTSLPSHAPLVLVLHGCTQTATDAQTWGWNELADQYGFAVGYPEQQTSNNSAHCFNWGGVYGNMTSLQRNQLENASIKQMSDTLVASHGLDKSRIFIVGFSAGAAEAVLVGATWPDVFAGVASIAGIPYACPTNFADVFTCQNPGVDKTAADWGAKVKAAFSSFSGTYPRLSVWQGSADTTVGTTNRTQIVRQWTNVHGASETPTASATVDGSNYTAFTDSAGKVVVESYEVPGMNHGVPVVPSKNCGATGTYGFDKGICASTRIAGFFGLIPNGSPTVASDGGVVQPTDSGANNAPNGEGGASSSTSGSSSSGGSPNGASSSSTSADDGGSVTTPGSGGVNQDDPRSAASTCAMASALGRSAGGGAPLTPFGVAVAFAAAGLARRRRRVHHEASAAIQPGASGR